MSYPLVIRLMLAMALMPDASYCESLARLAGVLADVPFALEWHVPTEKVVTEWRLPVPADLLEDLFWQAAGPLIGDDEPSAVLLAGMTVCAADGMLVNIADTAANRAEFGSTADGGRLGPVPAAAGRRADRPRRPGHARRDPGTGAGRGADPAEAARAAPRPDLFAGRVICFDRNFPGHELITAILDAGGHVIARVRARSPPLGGRPRLAARRISPHLAERPVGEGR